MLSHVDQYKNVIKLRSDKLTDYFLGGYFIVGLLLAGFYDNWFVAIVVGSLNLAAYYSAKIFLKNSDLYQYVLGAVSGIFMAQYIYEMHGMFEMHFIAFIGSAMLITYQNWKLQIPLAVVVVIHHAIFGYLQFSGFDKVYFTQLNYMDLQTFFIHVILAATIFIICGMWADQFSKVGIKHILQTYELATLEEAKKQNVLLVQANSELDKFVYSVSHDLRAPLSSMKGVIEISEEETSDEILLTNFSLLKGSIKKLDAFIQDILEYSRNSRMEVKKQEVNFKEMLEDICRDLKHMSSQSKKQVELTYSIINEKKIISDRTRINIVLNNLISNAIRYQNPDSDSPFVKVHIDMGEKDTSIEVVDNGIGISKENQDKIFGMFYRISENSVGSGLGLYLVKEVIEKLDGQIDVESSIGVGSKFKIKIPNNN